MGAPLIFRPFHFSLFGGGHRPIARERLEKRTFSVFALRRGRGAPGTLASGALLTDSFHDAVAPHALCFILCTGLVSARADRAVHVVTRGAVVHGSRPVDARFLTCVTDVTGMCAAEHAPWLLVVVQPTRFFHLSSIAQPTSLSGTVVLHTFCAPDVKALVVIGFCHVLHVMYRPGRLRSAAPLLGYLVAACCTDSVSWRGLSARVCSCVAY